MSDSICSNPVKQLLDKGVAMPAPESVYVDDSVDRDRIDSGCIIYPQCRIFGESTFIGPECIVGENGPVTIRDCQLERGVALEAGAFEGAVFLEGSSCGPGAHVRPGTVLEEYASAAHCVGLKQTILMPYVTLGSLVNLCDCMMAGGTGKRDHSEVGSSFVHFNFTPSQDKATASLIGDVPRGVMLDQRPIFLGGQGGLVGPARVEYGTVTAAGTILRNDVTEPGMLVSAGVGSKATRVEFKRGHLGSLRRKLRNNMHYIANLLALKAWYRGARAAHIRLGGRDGACCRAAVSRIKDGMMERCARLSQLADILRETNASPGDTALAGQCATVCDNFIQAGELGEDESRKAFLAEWENQDHSKSYVDVVSALSAEAKRNGTLWLTSIVHAVLAEAPEEVRG